jgi:hypothetical protein
VANGTKRGDLRGWRTASESGPYKGNKLGAGIELERGPVKGLLEDNFRVLIMEKR